MTEDFDMLDAADARAFLQRLSAQSQAQGEKLFRQGQVHELKAEKPGTQYGARVSKADHAVKIFYDADHGWSSQCDCARATDCAHAFAMMRMLLVEAGAAAVRNLSSGKALLAKPGAAVDSGDGASNSISRRLMAALSRSLSSEERELVTRIAQAYKRVKRAKSITLWDIQNMGFPVTGRTWDTLELWPELPENEYQFWLYVAHYLQRQGVQLPSALSLITDLTDVEKQIRAWNRKQEIDRWQKRLQRADIAEAQEEGRAEAVAVDLRLVLDRSYAFLEWSRPEHPDFEPMTSTQISHLTQSVKSGWVQFSPEAEILWQLFISRAYLSDSPHWGYGENDYNSGATLRRLLRLKVLESRVVSIHRKPLERPSEPLRWKLHPAEKEDDDYTFSLVQANGEPVAPVLGVIKGRPPLYLTADALYTGPTAAEGILNPREPTKIPAAALEQVSGLGFLQSLGLEWPERLRSRVRVLPFQVTIKCSLGESSPGSHHEDCSFEIRAEAEDGRQMSWNGNEWFEEKPAKKAKSNSNQISLYDQSAMGKVARVLAPLNLRWSYFPSLLTLRVTRRFPEIFSEWLKTVPPEFRLELDDELRSFADPQVSARIRLEVSEAEIDWFDLRVVLDVSDTTLTPEEIKLLLRAKGKYVRLRGKGWRRLQYDITEEEDERLARLGLNAKDLSDEPQRLHALQLADEAAAKILPAEQVEKIRRSAAEIQARVTPDLPSEVKAELRPYQLEGFHFLAYLSTNRFGGILADDMGLGKTLQTLAWLVWLRTLPREATEAKPAAGPCLVVCPKSVMDNWKAEAARFTPGLRVKVWNSGELPGFIPNIHEADLHVLNYNQLRSLGESLNGTRLLALILDEGQYIKNPSSQTAQIARMLSAEYRLILSGTPIENRLLDLWSLMSFAMPGVLGSRAQFGRLFDSKEDPFARRRLSARVRPFLLRRTKSQVARDLPDRIEEDLYCEMEGDQKTLYRAELKRAQQLLLRVSSPQDLARQQFNFLTCLLRLRQACCHPRLISDQTTAVGAKTEALLEQLEPLMEEGQKVLVFSQFVEVLDLLEPHLRERQWPLFFLAGRTENRARLVQDFQEASGPGVFLISLKAGGFGLNLTAASYVILFDPWWNPAVENQAIDRTHRIGQVNKVIAYRLLIKDSIEEKIRSLQKQKKALAEDVLGEEKFAQSLTLSDFQFLFAD